MTTLQRLLALDREHVMAIKEIMYLANGNEVYTVKVPELPLPDLADAGVILLSDRPVPSGPAPATEVDEPDSFDLIRRGGLPVANPEPMLGKTPREIYKLKTDIPGKVFPGHVIGPATLWEKLAGRVRLRKMGGTHFNEPTDVVRTVVKVKGNDLILDEPYQGGRGKRSDVSMNNGVWIVDEVLPG